jgi:hypothetical protein
MDMVYLSVYTDGFISSADLKKKIKVEFDKRKITLTPKASLIEKCNLYSVEKLQKRINGKVVTGYQMSRLKFVFR